MKKTLKLFTLMIFVLSFAFILTACGGNEDQGTPDVPTGGQTVNPPKTETPVGPTVKNEYKIRVIGTDNGEVTADVSSAVAGSTVTLTVKADFGYKLKEGSLKVNGTAIAGTSFTMPEADAEITAEFVVDAEELTVEETDMEFTVKSDKVNATAHVTTVFGETGLNIKYVVEDPVLILRDTKGDGVKLYLSKFVDSKEYLPNETYIVEVYIDGNTIVTKYDGTSFVETTGVTTQVRLFASKGSLAGYVVEINVPYTLWGSLTKDEAKGTLTMAPGLYNNNSTSSLVSHSVGYAKNFEIDPDNHNSFIVLVDDNTYLENENVYPGNVFKNNGAIVPNGSLWDLTNDTKETSGPITLSGHDSADNHLIFNMSSTRFMYAKVNMQLTDYFLAGDKFLKLGLTLFDGDATHGVFYYADLEANNTASSLSDIIGNKFGAVYMDGGYISWNTIDSAHLFDLDSMNITMELIFDSGRVYFFADGHLIEASYYNRSTDDLRIGIKNFGFGVTLTDYYCTTDASDSAISETLSKINRNVRVDDYGTLVSTNVITRDDITVEFGAVETLEGTYVKTLITTPHLPTAQSPDAGWWNWTNFEYFVNGQQAFIAIQANMEGVIDQYNVLTNYPVKGIELEVATKGDKYLITAFVYLGQLPADSIIKLNYFVIDGTRNAPVDNKDYKITATGLETIGGELPPTPPTPESGIDGKMEDAHWTETVLTNKYVFAHPNGEVIIDMYATRNEETVFFFANYQTKVLHAQGDWWQQDNFELRIAGANGLISNGAPNDPYQWRVSTSGECNFDQFFMTQPVLNDNGFYEIMFEFCVSYARLDVDAKSPLGFTMGANPGGTAWHQVDFFGSGNLDVQKKITSQGILDYCLEEECEHKYGEYNFTAQPTCQQDGSKEAHCLYCNHLDVVKIPATGEHVYDMATANVVTPSTCSVKGKGIGTCGCGESGEVELPLDLTNHADNWDASLNKCACGSVANGTVVDIDYANFHYLEFVMDGSQSFEIDVILTAEHNASSTEWGNLFTAEVYSPGWSQGGWSYRADWCGWGTWSDGGNATYTDVNNGIWQGKYFEASDNMDIILNLKYDAAVGKITVTMTYISNVDPYSAEVKHLTYTCSNIAYKGPMHVGFGCEKAKVTFNYAKVVSGNQVG